MEETDRVTEKLRALFPPGSTAGTIVRHVSRSGMTRDISVHGPDGSNVSYDVAQLLGLRVQNGGVRVQGVGMDMGFSIVYDMGRKLYPEGFDTIKSHGTYEDGTPRYWRNEPSAHEPNGGYAIKQRWL